MLRKVVITMKFSTFKYHVGQGIKGMFKNGFMSLAAVITVAASCFILIISLCICYNIDSTLNQIESDLRINLYLGDVVTDDMVKDIEGRIKDIDHITEVKYYTSDENLERAKDDWDNGEILEGLEDDNPMPASFELGIEGAKYEDEVIRQLESLQLYVESELNADTDTIERIYLDENGNQISEEEAQKQSATEAATEAATAPAAAVTQVVTSPAQGDAAVPAQNSSASAEGSAQQAATEAATAAAPQAAQSAAQPAQEASPQSRQTGEKASAETETELTTESANQPVPSSDDFMNFINATVAATAGSGIGSATGDVAEGSTVGATDEGVAGVNVYDASKYSGYEYEFKGIEAIKGNSETAHVLSKINTAVRIFSTIMVIILCVIAVSIIMNTIRLTVVVRKNEINIMKYVGATDWFIRWPFIVEGIIIGFFGSVIPTVVCFFAYNECLHIFTEWIPNFIQFEGALEVFAHVAPITVLFGVLLGVIGSVSSMRKYLRV